MIIRQPYPNELYHHGIKGMNWGVRRFQNEDGSLTEAGRRRYGIFGRLGERSKKRKVSRAAKIRAKQRTKAKTDEVKRAALEAETARLNAQREAEEAKTQLRAAKKENSLLNRAVKALPKKEPKEKPVKESKNSKKLAAAIEAGNDKKVSKLLEGLDNEEYAKALERINMKYSMDLAKKKYSTDKMREAVNKLNQLASGAGSAVNIYNVAAGIGSAFTGKDIPKINTKASDPLQKIEQMYKNQTQKAIADKAAASAKQEQMTLVERAAKHKKTMAELKSATSETSEQKSNTSEQKALPSSVKNVLKKEVLPKKGEYKHKKGMEVASDILNNKYGELDEWQNLAKDVNFENIFETNEKKRIQGLKDSKMTDLIKSAETVIQQRSSEDRSRISAQTQEEQNRDSRIRTAYDQAIKYDQFDTAKKLAEAMHVTGARKELANIAYDNTYISDAYNKADKKGKKKLEEDVTKRRSNVDLSDLIKTASSKSLKDLDDVDALAGNVRKIAAEISRATFNGHVDVSKLSPEAKKYYAGYLRIRS